MPPLDTPIPFRSRSARLIALLCLLAAGLYVQLFQHTLVWDEHLVTSQEVVTDPSWTNYQRSFQQTYRPLTLFSVAVDRLIWRGWPPGYPLDSLFYHLIVAILLFQLGRRWFSLFPRLVAAGIVLLHPVGSETILYLLGRPDLLATLWMLAALLTLERAMETLRPGRPLFWFYLFSLLALLSKESAILLAGFALLMVSQHTKQDGASYRQRLLWISPLALPPLFIAADRLMHLGLLPGAPLNSSAGFMGVSTMAATAGKGLQLVMLPVSLCPWYEALIPPFQSTTASALVFLAAISGLGTLAWRLRGRAPAVAMGLAWLLGSLVLIAVRANTLPEPMNPLAVRWLYPTVIGGALLVGAALELCSRYRLLWVQAIAITGLGALALLTWQAQQTWRSDFTLYEQALTCNPDSAFLSLQYISLLERSGRLTDADTRFALLLAHQPDHPGVLRRQVRQAMNRADYAKATTHAFALVKRSPSLTAYRTLGDLLVLTERPEEAVDAYRQALRRRANDMLSIIALGTLLERTGQWENAAGVYDEGLRHYPRAANLWYRKGRVLEARQQLPEAFSAFAEVITHDTACPDGYVSTARVLERLGRLSEADQVRRRYDSVARRPLVSLAGIPSYAAPCGAEPILSYHQPAATDPQ